MIVHPYRREFRIYKFDSVNWLHEEHEEVYSVFENM